MELDPSFSEMLSTEFQPRKGKKRKGKRNKERKKKVLFSLFKASFHNIFSSLITMIVMQHFNDKNILLFYYTAAS